MHITKYLCAHPLLNSITYLWQEANIFFRTFSRMQKKKLIEHQFIKTAYRSFSTCKSHKGHKQTLYLWREQGHHGSNQSHVLPSISELKQDVMLSIWHVFFLTKSCNTNFNFLVFFYGRVQQALIIIPRKEEARNELYFEEALYSSACLNMQALWKVAKRSRPTPLVCSTNSANVCNCTLHHGRAPHASKG